MNVYEVLVDKLITSEVWAFSGTLRLKQLRSYDVIISLISFSKHGSSYDGVLTLV